MDIACIFFFIHELGLFFLRKQMDENGWNPKDIDASYKQELNQIALGDGLSAGRACVADSFHGPCSSGEPSSFWTFAWMNRGRVFPFHWFLSLASRCLIQTLQCKWSGVWRLNRMPPVCPEMCHSCLYAPMADEIEEDSDEVTLNSDRITEIIDEVSQFLWFSGCTLWTKWRVRLILPSETHIIPFFFCRTTWPPWIIYLFFILWGWEDWTDAEKNAGNFCCMIEICSNSICKVNAK